MTKRPSGRNQSAVTPKKLSPSDLFRECSFEDHPFDTTADLEASITNLFYLNNWLHGDMRQRERNMTLQRLRDGRMRVLVATDVAARGIDVPGITHVINFDAPRQAEDYVHRIGRTGRAGRAGTAVTFVGHSERHLIRSIERYTGRSLRVAVIPGLEPAARPERAAHPGGPRFTRNAPPRGDRRPGGAQGRRDSTRDFRGAAPRRSFGG